MTAAEFRGDVERELEQLRRAHVIADVEVETDMVVGVRMSIDGKAYEMITHATRGELRQEGFALALIHLQQLRRHLMPSRRPTPPARLRIHLDRHVGEPSRLVVVGLAVICGLLAWVLS